MLSPLESIKTSKNELKTGWFSRVKELKMNPKKRVLWGIRGEFANQKTAKWIVEEPTA
jgi:hypothetical protein